MTSIHTNISAIAALHTLRSITNDLSETQSRVSSGLRVQTASDNSAYWSISTTMRSDNRALSAVTDALGLGAAKVDVAYTGMEAVIDILGEFNAKLVAAKEAGVDKAKIQKELAELKNQVVSIATSASFNGQNWLSTDIPDIFDETLNRTSVVSSFVRDAGGNITVRSLEVALSEMSLFNLNGGGLLQADPRDFKTVGGLRYPSASYSDGTQAMSTHPFNQRGRWDNLTAASTGQTNDALDKKSLAACTNAKKDGIEIYTIRLEEPDIATGNLLSDCASTKSNFFDAPSRSQLAPIFDAIKKGVVQLRLTS